MRATERTAVSARVGRARRVALAARVLVTVLATPAASAATPATEPAARIEVDEARGLLLDGPRGLAWDLCPLGMHWVATQCAGEPARMTRAEARRLLRGTDPAWHLPSASELHRHVEVLRAARRHLGAAGPMDSLVALWCWSGTGAIEAVQPNPFNYRSAMRGDPASDPSFRLDAMHGVVVNAATGEIRNDANGTERLAVWRVRSIAAAR